MRSGHNEATEKLTNAPPRLAPAHWLCTSNMTVTVRAPPVLVLGADRGRVGCRHEDHVCVPGLSGGCSAAVVRVPIRGPWDLAINDSWSSAHGEKKACLASVSEHLFCHSPSENLQARSTCLKLVKTTFLHPARPTYTYCRHLTPISLRLQITIKGHEIGENTAACAALLDHGPERQSPASSEAVVFKVQQYEMVLRVMVMKSKCIPRHAQTIFCW